MTRRRAGLAAAAAAVVAAVGVSQCWILRGRVATVEAGRLYRSAALSPGRLLDLCRRHRIAAVVDFRSAAADADAESALLEQAGIRHIGLPTGQVPSRETVAAFLRVMDDDRNRPVLMHCRHGVGRTGVFAAIYRMEYQGWPRWRAIAEAMMFAGLDSFGPGNPKTRFLRSYVPRRQEADR